MEEAVRDAVLEMRARVDGLLARSNGGDLQNEEAEQVELQLEVQARYAGYIERQQREIEKHRGGGDA